MGVTKAAKRRWSELTKVRARAARPHPSNDEEADVRKATEDHETKAQTTQFQTRLHHRHQAHIVTATNTHQKTRRTAKRTLPRCKTRLLLLHHNQTTACLSSDSAARALNPARRRRSQRQRPRLRWSPTCSTSMRNSAILHYAHEQLLTLRAQTSRHMLSQMHPEHLPRIRPQQG